MEILRAFSIRLLVSASGLFFFLTFNFRVLCETSDCIWDFYSAFLFEAFISDSYFELSF